MNYSINSITLRVADMDKSLSFYEQALGLQIVDHKKSGTVHTAALSDGVNSFTLNIVFDSSYKGRYELGDNETHVGFVAKDMEKALQEHKKMNCVCYENTPMGIYFIEDPDGYWMEVLPEKSPDQTNGTNKGFAFDHVNINVANSERAVEFYKQAFGLHVHREKAGERFKLVFLTDQDSKYKLELTFMNEHPEPYALGDNPRHLVFSTDDVAAAKQQHEKAKAHIVESRADGSYVVADPDGYLNEVIKTPTQEE